MRETLIRLAAALEMKKATEQEKKANLDSPLKALQQEAEKNSKLREFLMDCGQVVVKKIVIYEELGA
ncbi:hypothetical protein Bca101_019528 [Brassica carinata]